MQKRDINRSFKLADILRKHVRQQELNAEERILLNEWLKEDGENRKIFHNLGDDETLANAINRLYQTDTVVQLEIVKDRIRKRSRIKQLKRWLPAAAIVAFLGIGGWLYLNGHSVSDQQTIVNTANNSDDVLPGSNRATLSLDGGKNVVLNEDKKGLSVTNDSITYADGTGITNTTNVKFATLTTPRAGQYQLTLPDGTNVWLNAESSIRYPTRFTADKREVETSGEVYFEVAHDLTKPFIVETPSQRIEVLGTEFNINSYSDHSNTATTLVSGSIKLHSNIDNTSEILEPGQQAILGNNGIKVVPTDIAPFVAWKNGEFRFKATPIYEVLHQIERWYDIDVVYDGIPQDIEVYAYIRRDKKLSSVLVALEEITNLKFRIQERSLMLMMD